MELLNTSDDFEQKIEKMRVENLGLEYEEENDYQSLDQESEYEEEEQPFNPEKIRVDQQMLSVKYMLELIITYRIIDVKNSYSGILLL